MPTIEDNRKLWDAGYEWDRQGEEWSATWGGSAAQWQGAIRPRLGDMLPADTVLEIAPGCGRWTHYLKDHCRRLVAVDLAENCVIACRQRFAADAHVTCHANDGKSLAMIGDRSVDFVFSFDSLVHAEPDVIRAYLEQLAVKLKPDGRGFIHHSNLGQYPQGTLPDGRPAFSGKSHWRSAGMTAARFAEYCERAGLACIGQELVNWGNDECLIDCFSQFTPRGSKWARQNVMRENAGFMREAHEIRRRAGLAAGAGKAT